MEMLFELLTQHVYVILFISLILEFAALPLPGETMMLFAGIMAYNGHGNYIGMILASAIGTIIGMQFSYEVGRRLGTKAIDKYGSYVGLTPHRMTKAAGFFNKYGNIVIVIAYFLPGVRHILGYFSGISRIDSKKFHTYSTLGGIFWVGTFITLGYILGPSSKHVFNLMHKYGVMLVMLCLVAVIIYLIFIKLGKKDFLLQFNKIKKIVIPIFVIVLGAVLYISFAKIGIGPKKRDNIIFILLGFLLVLVVLYYIKVLVKNTTSNKVLVVVDFQKDFVDGSLGFDQAKELENVIANKIEEYLKNGYDVIFTLDTHYESNYLSTREGRHLPVEHCLLDSDGHELYGKVSDYKKDAKKIFEKNTFGSIDLARYISKSDYTEVEFCGLVSNICVLSNLILVQNYNDKVEIIVDLEATKSNDEEVNATFKKYLEQLTVNVKK